MSFTIIDSEIIAGAVIGFKGKKYNCIQEREGEKAGEAWIEFVQEDKDQEFSQAIFDDFSAISWVKIKDGIFRQIGC